MFPSLSPLFWLFQLETFFRYLSSFLLGVQAFNVMTFSLFTTHPHIYDMWHWSSPDTLQKQVHQELFLKQQFMGIASCKYLFISENLGIYEAVVFSHLFFLSGQTLHVFLRRLCPNCRICSFFVTDLHGFHIFTVSWDPRAEEWMQRLWDRHICVYIDGNHQRHWKVKWLSCHSLGNFLLFANLGLYGVKSMVQNWQ